MERKNSETAGGRRGPGPGHATRALALALALTSAAGCIHIHLPPDAARQAPRGGLGLAPGDRVLARWQGQAHEATVFTVQGKLVTVAWDQPPPPRSMVPRAWVSKIGGVPEAAAGDLVYCRQGGAWGLCRLTAPGEGRAAVSCADGVTLRPAAEDLAPVPAGLRAQAKERARRLEQQRALKASINPGPPTSAGSPAAEGAAVLARWSDGNWYLATVTAVEKGGVTVRWRDGSGQQRLRPELVAPLPDMPPTLAPGDLAHCRWSQAGYWPARVDRVTSGGALEVTYQDGATSRVPSGGCIAASQNKKTKIITNSYR